ncbi:MAG: hypothetical protein AB1758_05660 [Candidatus Eremiobacterota bacterium]
MDNSVTAASAPTQRPATTGPTPTGSPGTAPAAESRGDGDSVELSPQARAAAKGDRLAEFKARKEARDARRAEFDARREEARKRQEEFLASLTPEQRAEHERKQQEARDAWQRTYQEQMERARRSGGWPGGFLGFPFFLNPALPLATAPQPPRPAGTTSTPG